MSFYCLHGMSESHCGTALKKNTLKQSMVYPEWYEKAFKEPIFLSEEQLFGVVRTTGDSNITESGSVRLLLWSPVGLLLSALQQE